ncbi:MAG: hypothetical protein FWE10_03115 [Rikenellaceae bacterium]|nr:hypothetical protein [Rikenellaceae bacterium]MCL2693150.1 hypothetical protein [Rikenellaceae bacterium]
MTSNANNKKRVVISYHNLSPELQIELRKKYPLGFTESMIRIEKGPGDFFYAVVFETDEVNYLVKIDVKVDGGNQQEEEEDKEFYDEDDIKGADDLADGDSDDE